MWGTNQPEITGISQHRTPREAATGASILLTVIDDADALHEALTDTRAGALEALGAAAWWLNLSPVPAGGGIDTDALARQYGVVYQHTPVHEANGTMVVIGPASGDPRARAVCDSILATVGPITSAGTEAAHLSISALPRRVNDTRVLPGIDERQWELETALLAASRPAAPCH